MTNSKKAPEVIQLTLSGYCVNTRWYFFKNFAVDTKGTKHFPNKRGIYKAGYRDFYTPPAHASEKAIKPADSGPTTDNIHRLLIDAWGNKGAMALGWVVAGWFVNQIKQRIGFFPFLSCFGDPGAGKSALVIALNALQGFDKEGLSMSSLSSKKGLARSISRVSGLFTALLEDSQRNEKSFDFSVLLTAYNVAPLLLSAKFTNDNQTTEAPFQGTMMFVANRETFKEKQEKQRFISLEFKHPELNENTKTAYEKLSATPLSELARILPLTLQHREVIENEWFGEYQKAITDISPQDNQRILQNHALILAFYRLFCRIHTTDHNLTEFARDTAELKCITAEQQSHTPACHFFEVIDELDTDKLESCVNTDTASRLIHISLPGVEQLIRNKGLQFSVNNALMESLRTHPAYIQHGKNFRFPGTQDLNSEGRPKLKKSWVFNADKI